MSRPILRRENIVETEFDHQPQSAVAARYIDPSSTNSKVTNGNGNQSQAKVDESDVVIIEKDAFDQLPTLIHPTESLSVTAAQAAGAAESSPYFKIMESNMAMKPDSPNSKPRELPNFEQQEVRDAEKQMKLHQPPDNPDEPLRQSPPKRRRVSIVDVTKTPPHHNADVPSTPSTPSAHTMTAKEKRASCAASLTRSLEAVDGVDEITADRRAELAKQVEEALFLAHPTLNHAYITAARDLAYNLYHNQEAARRLLDGRILPNILAQMDWKSLAVKELKIERAEHAHEDLIEHLAPADVVPGVQPNSETTQK